ncbi:hypothetical protein TGAMA5MH_00374 [Trichoderma gamsii]|uniref:Uncharacterized protein n=1 Tax=Trichoderma gamsii TaxID=398673 RepID=A0A2K0TSH1_9HYPO|nr:hypothetical protein TGAMA5MH_00374 [Trichoderma gamsii]
MHQAPILPSRRAKSHLSLPLKRSKNYDSLAAYRRKKVLIPKSQTAKAHSPFFSSLQRNGCVSKLVVELKVVKGRDRSQFEESILTTDDDDDVQFVKQQQSSTSSKNDKTTPKPTEARRSRQSSVDLMRESTIIIPYA